MRRSSKFATRNPPKKGISEKDLNHFKQFLEKNGCIMKHWDEEAVVIITDSDEFMYFYQLVRSYFNA